MDISVVLPCYNTDKTLENLAKRLILVLEDEGKSFEIIMVNDASPSEDWEVIKKLASGDKRIKGINLSRNFGQYEAITAGLDYASGDNVVLMDADLQDIPEELPKLLRAMEKGYDAAYGVRSNRQDVFFKKATSQIFHKIFNYLSGIKTDKGIATYAVYSRKMIDVLSTMRERYREISILFSWMGFNTVKVEIEHAKRTIGKTSYTFKKSINLAMDAMFAYSIKPLKLAVVLGFCMSFISFIFGAFFLIRALLGLEEVEGWSSLIFSIWFIGGIVLFFIGVLGIYIGKIFEEVKKRPLYIVNDLLNFSEDL